MRRKIIFANRNEEFSARITMLKSIPGINDVWACIIAAEVGPFDRLPDLGVIIGEWTVAPQDREGLLFTSVVRVGNPDPTVFGTFPDAEYQSDHIGQTVWTGSPAYESTYIGYGTKKAEIPGQLPEIVYISVIYAKTKFVDRNTLNGEGTHAFYLASQDVDGDGLPDEGQEPAACFPYISTAKRVQLMPPCVPPPSEGE